MMRITIPGCCVVSTTVWGTADCTMKYVYCIHLCLRIVNTVKTALLIEIDVV